MRIWIIALFVLAALVLWKKTRTTQDSSGVFNGLVNQRGPFGTGPGLYN